MQSHIRVYIASLDRTALTGVSGSGGITLCDLDSATGSLRTIQFMRGIGNPMSLAIGRNGGVLYAVSQAGEGELGGLLSAFAIDGASGELRLVAQQPTGGSKPLYVSVDAESSFAFVANLGSGSVAVLPLDAGGVPLPAAHVQQHHGSSINPQRQEGPHVHSVIADPSGRFVIAADLGTDHVATYRLERPRGALIPLEQAAVRAGLGPRHLEFHPTKPILYLLSEMGSTITSFRWNAEATSEGGLSEIQTISTLPAGYAGTSTAADIHASLDGRHVYASNRGHDSLAVFQVEPTGLGLLRHEPTLGSMPQSFALCAGGRLVIVGNRDSDSVGVFTRNADTGALAILGATTKVATPVCVKVLER